MFNYSLKVSMLIELWEKCPFSGLPLVYTKFMTSEFQIDHIYSIPRKSKNKSFLNENIDFFESVINLRPLHHSHHIEFHTSIPYESYLKFTRDQFLRICEELKQEQYEPLLMKNYYPKEVIKELLKKFWSDCLVEKRGFIIVEKPDWHIS